MNLDKAAELACRQPKMVARRAKNAGLCEVDEYLLFQELYGRIASRDHCAAEIFADELKNKGLVLACAG
jgi:hypothetical protein